MAVGIVPVSRGVVRTQTAQQQAVVHQPLDGLQQECVERQVAYLLEFKLSVDSLQLFTVFCGLFQFCEDLVVSLEVASKLLLRHKRTTLRCRDVMVG